MKTFGSGARDVLELPHDREAEGVVIAATLIDPSRLKIAQSIISSTDFYGSLNQRAFRAIEQLGAESPHSIDLVSVCRTMESAGGLTNPDRAQLAGLLGGMHRGAAIEHHCRVVAEKSRRRRIMKAANATLIAAGNGADPEEIDRLLTDLQEAARTPGEALPAESLKDVLLRPAPKTPWAIEGLLAERDIAFLSGAGGIGKSWLALWIGLMLASGHSLFDRFPITRPYRIAFIDLESRSWEVDQRLCRLVLGAGELGDIGSRVQIVRCRLRLDDERDLNALISSLATWGTDVMIVDSFRRAFRGDENESGEVSALFTGALDRIRLETGAGSILVDHHRKKCGQADLDGAAEALRGSADKRAMCDAHFGVEARNGQIAFLPTKTRHSRLPEGLLLSLDGLEAGASEDGPVTITCAGSASLASDAVQDTIIALLEESSTGSVSRGELIGRSRYSERAVDDALSALKRKDRVRRKTVGKQAHYSLANSLRPQRPQTTAEEKDDRK